MRLWSSRPGFFPTPPQKGVGMFDAATYRIRRRRRVNGIGYEILEDGEVILAWTRRTADLATDFELTTPDGEPTLRVTTDNLVPDVAAAFTVVDARDGGVLGLIKRDWASIVRREFELVDRYDLAFARVRSKSRIFHIARNQFIKLVPYWYEITDTEGQSLGSITGGFRGGCSITMHDTERLDPRMVVGTAVAVDAVEMLV
jgi:hypothetical protein